MKIPAEYFGYISIGIAVIFFALVIIGYIKGFLFELVNILYNVLSIFASWFVAPILASKYPLINIAKLYPDYAIIANLVNLDALLNSLAYFLICFLLLKVFSWVLSLLLKGINKIPVLGKVNRVLGAVVGAINGLLVCLALSMLLTLPIFKNGVEVRNGTILRFTNKLNTFTLNLIADNVDLDNIKNQFGSFDVDNAREDFKNWLDNFNE